MKFTTLLSSVALCALQTAHAAPAAFEERDIGYCCVEADKILGPSVSDSRFFYLQRGPGLLPFVIKDSECVAIAHRNSLDDCSRWSFSLTQSPECDAFKKGRIVQISVMSAETCKSQIH
ncbi:hypothetical protein E4U21_005337 [Claviceps maximensis]|nr:hypothetical protein E4U21_005337 [Claviceps maximensis]